MQGFVSVAVIGWDRRETRFQWCGRFPCHADSLRLPGAASPRDQAWKRGRQEVPGQHGPSAVSTVFELHPSRRRASRRLRRATLERRRPLHGTACTSRTLDPCRHILKAAVLKVPRTARPVRSLKCCESLAWVAVPNPSNRRACPRLSHWEDWGVCSKPCGVGQRTA